MNNSTDQPGTAADVQTASPPALGLPFLGQVEGDRLSRQRAVVAMGRRAVAQPDLPVLLQDAATLLAEVLDTEYSTMAELSPDGKSLRLRLAPGKTHTAKASTPAHETSAAGTDSLAAYVLQIGHPVVVANLAQDKRFVDMFLRKHRIRSAVAVPLKLQDRSFGSLAACSRDDRHFDDEDVLFVETIAHLVTTEIARTQAEKSLADERRFTDGVLQTVDALVLVLDTRGRIIRINSACERVTGFSLDEIKGRPIWNVFSVPEEVDAFQGVLAKLQAKECPVGHEGYLLTKHSERRRIAWSYSAMTADDGALASIIATGTEITEPPPTHVERRKHPRRSYPYKQRIAAVVDGKLPDQNAFSDVQCNDVAAGGFSYLSPTPPPSDRLVVALGIPPKVTYLIAQVAHVTRVVREGQQKFLIGCNYVGRAVY